MKFRDLLNLPRVGLAIALMFILVSCSASDSLSSLAPTVADSNPSSVAPNIFMGNPETVTQQDVALAFAFSTLQPGSPSGADLIARANLLLPGSDLDIPTTTTLNPTNPTLQDFKVLMDGGTTVTQQDLAVFFAAFTLLSTEPDPGSVTLTSQQLCDRANLLLPGSDLDIPAASCGQIKDPRTGTTPSPSPTLTPTPTPSPSIGTFAITLSFPDQSLNASQKQVFETAAARWAELIVQDVPDTSIPGAGLVDDLLIEATGIAIDGEGGILGQAGPQFLRDGSFLPISGIMQFDIADLAQLETDGQLDEVIVHEMGHVIGIGTIWSLQGLLQAAGTNTVNFSGSEATTQFNQIFGLSAASVPVENQGGQGTADSHWRETIFDNELMTGFLNPGVANPLSKVTVGSLKDLGYFVNLDAADSYTKPNLNAPLAKRDTTAWEVILPPKALIDSQGRVTPIGLGKIP